MEMVTMIATAYQLRDGKPVFRGEEFRCEQQEADDLVTMHFAQRKPVEKPGLITPRDMQAVDPKHPNQKRGSYRRRDVTGAH